MFTGLIEEIGQVTVVDATPAGSRVTISASPEMTLSGLALGDSVSVDGACTTVVAFDDTSFLVEVTPETLDKTRFSQYQPGTRVNLERPLMPTSRLGGHYVTGHVDGQAEVITIQAHGNSWIYRFKVENDSLAALLVEKGSVAVNGISLTVNTVINDVFSVAIIPHTLEHTNIQDLAVGSRVNIETDLLGKYVQRLLQYGSGQGSADNNLPLPHIETSVSPQPRIRAGSWFNHD